MSYHSWLTPSKLSGSGNDIVNVSTNASNTGRNSRSTNITFKAANCEDVIRSVVQAGKPESVSILAAVSVVKTGSTVTIAGTSNSSKLTFSLGSGELQVNLPSSYIAAGVNTANGAAISGDPGADQEYAFSIQIEVDENTTVSSRSRQLIVTDNGGHTAICTITQAAGDAYLTVSPASVEIPWDGSTSAAFTVSSNTNWTIE